MANKTKTGLSPDPIADEIAAAADFPHGNPATTASNDTSDSIQDRASTVASDLRDRAGEIAGDLRGKATDAAQTLRERASGAVGDAQDWASDARESGRRRVEDLANRGTERLGQHKSAVEQFVTENPLLVGVVGLAAGLLIGSLLPRTRSEDEAVGPWADEVRGQGLRYARDFTNRGREFVESALDPDNLNAAAQRATEPKTAPEAPVNRPH